MATQFLMGVDVGTQSSKVVIFDLEGNIVAEGRQPLRKMLIPAPLLAIHPDDDLWDSLKIAFRAAMDQFGQAGHDPTAILAMGVCIIRCCRVLMRADGELAYPVINWMDKRLNSPYEHLAEYGDVRWVTTTSGYITHRLTGEAKDTCANHIGWWPMDQDTWDWSTDPAVLRSCNLSRDMLFDVVKPGEILGHVTAQAAEAIGVPAGIPVVATAHDKAVEALGAGSLDPGTALISLGTYIGAMVHGHANVKDAKHFWPFMASIPDCYLYECMGVRRGMWTISWFAEQLAGGLLPQAQTLGLGVEDILNQEAAHVPAGCEGLITVHDWAPPAEATYRKGVMLGFDGRHTRAHMYRSVLEGIGFTIKNHVDKMTTELGQPLTHLVISGGGANSDLFMRIFADIFGIPARRNQMKGSAAIGCAINAGMAVGAFASYDQAIAKLVKVGDEFPPNLDNTKVYDQLNEKVYKRVNQHLDPLLMELAQLVD